jgi:hypothetical protein
MVIIQVQWYGERRLLNALNPKNFLEEWMGTPWLFKIVPLFRSLLSVDCSGV